MPKNLTETLVVTLLDKEYQVTCPAEEKNELIQSSHDLDRRMRGIRASGNVMGIERIAVMAALNLCHEVLQLNRQLQTQLQQNKELEKMTDKVEQSLAMLKHVSCETEDQALTKFSQ